MTEPEIYAVLTTIFNDVFLRDDLALTPATTAADIPGWDSFKQIEIIMATEERLGIRLATQEIDRLNSVGALASLIARKRPD